MKFDDLIREGRDIEAVWYLANELYNGGKIGHTRKLLLERLGAQLAEAQASITQLGITLVQERERLAEAQADNVALIDVLKSIHRYIHPHNSPQYSKFIDDLIDTVKDNLHPGDPIRKELEQYKRALEAVYDLHCKSCKAHLYGVIKPPCKECYFGPVNQALAQAKAGEQHG